MPKKTSSSRLSIALLLLIAGITVSVGLRGTRAAENNTIRIQAGETLEIGTDMASPKSDFSWILTKDRKFQSAQRTRFFQTRLAEPGTYVLDVSVQDPVTSENGYRAFTLVVTEPTGDVKTRPGNKTNPLSAVVQTDPPVMNGSVYLPPEGGILKIDPSASDGNIASYHFDLDLARDSNGDGVMNNDVDNLGTLSEKSGTPLYVFLLPSSAERKLQLTVTDINAAEPKTAEIPVQFALSPAASSSSFQSGSTVNLNSPVILQREGATVRFSARLPDADVAGREILYEWDFGDRSKSLLYAPVHTYSAPGNYTLGLRIRAISNAEVLYEGTETLVIDFTPEAGSSSSSSSSASSSAVTTGGTSKPSMKGILQVSFIIILLLGFAIGLYLLFTWIKRKTATGLQKTLEKMEGTLVNKSGPDTAKPAVMKLKKENPRSEEGGKPPDIIIEKEQAQQEFRSQERTNETPIASAGPVPAWLAKASTTPAPQAASAPMPPSFSTTSPVTPVFSTPAPVPPSTSTPPAASPPPSTPAPIATPAPAWLKPAPEPTPSSTPKTSKANELPKPAPAASQRPPVPAPIAPKPTPPPPSPFVPTPSKSTPRPPAPEVSTPILSPKPSAPASLPKPAKEPTPSLPPTPNISEKIDDDPPIAFIQADSISK